VIVLTRADRDHALLERHNSTSLCFKSTPEYNEDANDMNEPMTILMITTSWKNADDNDGAEF
jgi:hypothetical protein